MQQRRLKLKQASAVLQIEPKELQNLVQFGVVKPHLTLGQNKIELRKRGNRRQAHPVLIQSEMFSNVCGRVTKRFDSVRRAWDNAGAFSIKH
jgi:hypothetical protein